ncbi:MAG: hypothetical protein ACRDBA_01655 [Clostridium sp.]
MAKIPPINEDNRIEILINFENPELVVKSSRVEDNIIKTKDKK